MLVGLLKGDEAAPVYVLRIWAHCQNRRQGQFENLPPEALKALCRFPGHANSLESSLTASGFIRREGTSVIVCNWEIYNAGLIASWENGQKGGRPPSEKPPHIPNETHGKPTGLRRDETRRDENGEDIKSRIEIGSGASAGRENLPPIDVTEVDWSEVAAIAAAVAKLIPPNTEEDRVLWLKYATMATSGYSQDWIMSAAEYAASATRVRKSRQAIFVSALQKSALKELGIDKKNFNQTAERIIIPPELLRT